MNAQRILQRFLDRQQAMMDDLEALTNIESPTDAPERVNAVADWLEARLHTLGASVERQPTDNRGDLLLGRLPGLDGQLPLLLIGHMDTVWPAGTLASRPFYVQDGVARGPGVLDMKAGLVIMLHAVAGVLELEPAAHVPLVVMLNPDEEMQSTASRSCIEREARLCQAALVFEGSRQLSRVTTSRKASGRFRITAHGVASHAGNAIQDGANAIEELASQVLVLQQLTDMYVGTTVNVGLITGGTRPNVVPDLAQATVSVRAQTPTEMRRIEEQIRTLKPTVAGCSLEVDGGFHRGVFAETSSTRRVFDRYAAAAGTYGVAAEPAASGGASDANLTAAVGTPTLDGLGGVGTGAHSIDEHVDTATMPVRAAIVTQMLLQWAGTPPTTVSAPSPASANSHEATA